jgi:hypothetical protein
VARTVLQWLNEPPFTARIDNGEQIRALQGEAEGGDRLGNHHCVSVGDRQGATRPMAPP